MVDFVCYGRGDARTFDLYDFANGTAVYSEQTSESFRIDYVDDGVSKTTYIYGFGFEYFPPETPGGFAGAPSTGTTTSATNYIGDTLNATVTGLNISTPQAYEYIQWNDPQRVSADVFKGNDTITGSVFDDYLDGWAGADTFIGGEGSDTYLFDNVGDRAFEDADSGIDTIVSSLTLTLGANIENLTLTGTANLNGTGNDLDNILIGNAGRNILTGGLGSDTLNGGGGTDRLVGGLGNDTYVISVAGATVIEATGEGTDTVRAVGNYTLGANIENLVLTGASGNGTGNALANTLTGNAGNNVLDGKGGADTLIGGLGNDTYVIDNPGDVIVELSGQGNDTVRALIHYTMADNLERLELASASNISGTGNAGANTIVGGSGANTLTGLGGKDTLTGGAGRDTFVFTSLSDSTVAVSGRDTITDFNQSETDRIDLRLIDANIGLEGDQAFSLIGTSAFSGVAGQLRYEASGSDTLVSGDVDGNGAADFAVLLTGSFTLARGDFLL